MTTDLPANVDRLTMTTDLSAYVDRLRSGEAPQFPPEADTIAFARRLDEQDKLRHLRDEFLLPTKASLKKRALDGSLPGMYAVSSRVRMSRVR